MFGFLNIYKPKGITSHDVISRLRKILHIKKIGHAGTLDPLAEGVLPVAISGAARLIDLLSSEKEYLADFQLGVVSASYDSETEFEHFSDKKVGFEEVDGILNNFKGTIKQKPPIYSAVKVQGKKLYEFAREGENIDIREREITVNKIVLNRFDEQTQCGQLLINCSKGTYIRSIINDIGQLLNTGAVMTGLIRSKSGGFNVENSVKLEDISDINIAEKFIVPVSEILPFPQISLDDRLYNKVSNGNSFFREEPNGFVFLKYENKIIALGEVVDNTVKIRKVFV